MGTYFFAASGPRNRIAPSGRVFRRRYGLALAAAVLSASAGGCASTIALDRAVMAYDTTTADSVSKQLLLNIARARHNQPMHFTAISSIAATYKFSVSAGVGPALTGERGGLLVPSRRWKRRGEPHHQHRADAGRGVHATAADAVSGAEAHPAVAPGLRRRRAVRLMGAEIRLENMSMLRTGERDGALQPSLRPGGVSDLPARDGASVFDTGSPCPLCRAAALPVQLDHSCRLRDPGDLPVDLQGLFSDLRRGEAGLSGVPADQRPGHRSPTTTRRSCPTRNASGCTRRRKRRRSTTFWWTSDRDIRVASCLCTGRLRLRSFHEILTFIGRGIEEEPEYDVPPDPRTPSIRENPASYARDRRSAALAAGSRSVRGLARATSMRSRPQRRLPVEPEGFQPALSVVPDDRVAAVQTGPAITISK